MMSSILYQKIFTKEFNFHGLEPEEVFRKYKESVKKINKLVLSGGAFRGYAYVGFVRYLEETGIIKQMKTIVGTSIGALISVLLCIGYTSHELEAIMKHFDFKKYQSVDIMSLFEKFGIDTFEKLKSFIGLLFMGKGLPTNITFGQLFEKTGIHLIINTTCLNTRQRMIFDHIKNPEAPVMTILQASMAMPYVFASVLYGGLLHVDGGVLDNFMINLFEDDPESVLGVKLHTTINYSVSKISHIEHFSYLLFSCLYHAYHELLQQTNQDYHIVRINVTKFDIFDFNLDNENKEYLFNLGYQCGQSYFEIDLINNIIKSMLKEQNTQEYLQIDQHLKMLSPNQKQMFIEAIKLASTEDLDEQSVIEKLSELILSFKKPITEEIIQTVEIESDNEDSLSNHSENDQDDQ